MKEQRCHRSHMCCFVCIAEGCADLELLAVAFADLVDGAWVKGGLTQSSVSAARRVSHSARACVDRWCRLPNTSKKAISSESILQEWRVAQGVHNCISGGRGARGRRS